MPFFYEFAGHIRYAIAIALHIVVVVVVEVFAASVVVISISICNSFCIFLLVHVSFVCSPAGIYFAHLRMFYS